MSAFTWKGLCNLLCVHQIDFLRAAIVTAINIETDENTNFDSYDSIDNNIYFNR